MLAGSVVGEAGTPLDGEPASFLSDKAGYATEAEVIAAIDSGVGERCYDCLPATAHHMLELAQWVGVGRLPAERAAMIINERTPCGHLGSVAMTA